MVAVNQVIVERADIIIVQLGPVAGHRLQDRGYGFNLNRVRAHIDTICGVELALLNPDSVDQNTIAGIQVFHVDIVTEMVKLGVATAYTVLFEDKIRLG